MLLFLVSQGNLKIEKHLLLFLFSRRTELYMRKPQIEYFFKTVSLQNLFFLLVFGKLFITGLLSYLVTVIDEKYLHNPIEEEPNYMVFFASVLFAPFIEALLFQSLIFYLGKKFRLKNSLIIVVSTLAFALTHHYNLIYFSVTIFSGLFYACTYSYISKRESTFIAFFFVSSIHAINNLTAWLFDILS